MLHHGLKFTYNKTIPAEKVPNLFFILTSEKNVLSIDGTYYDGEVLTHSLNPGKLLNATLQPKKYKQLNHNNGKCRSRPFFEIFMPKLLSQKFENCPMRCNPKFKTGFEVYDLDLASIPICKTKNEIHCFLEVFFEVKDSILLKPCNTLEFLGKIKSSHNFADNYQSLFMYTFNNPGLTIVHEEYMIFDFVTMIGSIGGTLGLCIGFSYTNTISYLLGYLKNTIKKCQGNSHDQDLQVIAPMNQAIVNEISMLEKFSVIEDLCKNMEKRLINVEKSMPECEHKN